MEATLGGLDVCDLVVLRTGSANCEAAAAPETVRLEGGPGGGGSWSGSSDVGFNLDFSRVDVGFNLVV